jgi:hypothetical protein
MTLPEVLHNTAIIDYHPRFRYNSNTVQQSVANKGGREHGYSSILWQKMENEL